MAQVNIKPNRVKFIQALEAALLKGETETKQYETDLKQYNKDLEAWRASANLSPENIKSATISTNHHFSNMKPSHVVVELKKYPTGMPKRPTEPESFGYMGKARIAELKSVIAMLKLTDEDTVSASVANKVAQYI
jgi:hypothetical protein